MKTVREWLPDFYSMTDGNEIRRILAGLWDCEVQSIWHARALVNTRIDAHIAWAECFKFNFQDRIEKLIEHGIDIPNI